MKASGFTLVELLLVITLVAILATVAGPRFFDAGTFDERGYHDELAAALRYAQKVAVASGCPVRASVSAAGYTLGQQNDLGGRCDPSDVTFAQAVPLPDGQAMSGTTPPGLIVAPAVAILFGADGGTDLAADQTLAIGSRSLTVNASSGLVVAP